jgi:hypothetical protein
MHMVLNGQLLCCELVDPRSNTVDTDILHSNTSTNDQKKDWYLRLNPNGNQHLPLSNQDTDSE